MRKVLIRGAVATVLNSGHCPFLKLDVMLGNASKHFLDLVHRLFTE